MNKDDVRRAYDDLAPVYAEQRTGDGEGMAILTEFLDSLPESPRVLDAGCGQGTPVLTRLASEADPVGLDFSREQVTLAAENVPDAPLAQGDMTALPFGTDAFDAVVAYWSLIHVPMDDHQTVIDEFARVLRSGGRVLVCEGTNEWAGENPDWLESGVRMEWNIAGAAETRAQLQNAGFEVTDTWGAPETMNPDEEDGEETGDSDDDHPWTFFSARLES
ncbi:class I SAM-dependent methyltransferase [Haloferax sp. S1W]|uniref:class I SAM-dependent methyltransferase n=1 Tax=Haloferax sp. S1W TaxID=3377110 RepID=UPI0037CA81AC